MKMEKYLQIDCLKHHIVSDTVLESILEHLPHSTHLCHAHDIMNGPLKRIPLRNNRWNVINYEKVKFLLIVRNFMKTYKKLENVLQELIFGFKPLKTI